MLGWKNKERGSLCSWDVKNFASESTLVVVCTCAREKLPYYEEHLEAFLIFFSQLLYKTLKEWVAVIKHSHKRNQEFVLTKWQYWWGTTTVHWCYVLQHPQSELSFYFFGKLGCVVNSYFTSEIMVQAMRFAFVIERKHKQQMNWRTLGHKDCSHQGSPWSPMPRLKGCWWQQVTNAIAFHPWFSRSLQGTILVRSSDVFSWFLPLKKP